MLKRLYIQVYLTIVASLVLVVLAAGILWRSTADFAPMREAFELAGEIAAAALPPPDAAPPVQAEALARLSARLGIDLALFSPARDPIASIGRPLPPPPASRRHSGWLRGPSGPAWLLRFPDGRWLVAGLTPRQRNPAFALILSLGIVALLVAVAALPLARRVTRRLERLQSGVERLGAGDLAARVTVEGRDEVARLARSFNRAAERIEDLVRAHKLMLANASHELRTPLARIRLAIELARDRIPPDKKAALAADIGELDQLIDEILLASRLDATPDIASEEIDLLALAAEECGRYEACEVGGESVIVRGDPRLLRRLIRNLLENAARHGVPPIEVTVRREGGGAAPGEEDRPAPREGAHGRLDGRAGLSAGARAVLDVADRGPALPEAERAHIFAPFRRASSSGSGGTGLGLSLVKQIAERHGGEAMYAPRPDGTSRFRVNLPALPTGRQSLG